MKLTTEDDVRDPAGGRHARGSRAVFLLTLAAAAGPFLPLHAAVMDDMCPPVKFQVGSGGMDYLEADLVDCQLVFSGQFPGPTQPIDPLRNYDNVYWPNSLSTVSLLNRTLEVRMDLVQVSGDDVFLVLGVDGPSGGYEVAIDQNELVLAKYHGSGTSTFAWNTVPVTYQNVTVVLSLTRTTNAVQLAARIVDQSNHERILYEIPFTDGPGQDPVIPTPPRDLTFFTAPDSGPPLASFSVAWVGVWQYAATSPSPVEVVVDNFEYDVYAAPVLGIKWPSVLLPWSANTAEEQIVVGAGSLASDAVWTPWPEPIFKRFGKLCMAVPTNATQQFFKLVPGTQFIDDFDSPKWPYATKGDWVPVFFNIADPTRFEVTNVDNALRVRTVLPPLNGRIVVLPPGPDVVVGDFYASVDILNWPAGARSFGIAARAQRTPSFPESPAYLGLIGRNPDELRIFDAVTTHLGTPFTYDPAADYRLEFSGVGSDLFLRLVDLTTGSEVSRVTLAITRLNQGAVALWANVEPGGSCDITLDNFFVTGTKP